MKSKLLSVWPLITLTFSQLILSANVYAATYAPGAGLSTTLQTTGQAWWDAISIGGMWVTGLALAVCWMFGLTQYWRWAAGGFMIFVLGDVAVKFFIDMGAENPAK